MDEASMTDFNPFEQPMPDETTESFIPFATPEGIAGLWLADQVPTADRNIQVSLGAVFEGVMAEAMAKAIRNAIATMESSPNMMAAISSMEVDLIELERAIQKKRDEGIDFDLFSL